MNQLVPVNDEHQVIPQSGGYAHQPQRVNANNIAQHIGYDEEITVTQTTTVKRQGIGSNAVQPEMVELPIGLKEWIGISIASGVFLLLLVSLFNVAMS